MATALRRTLLAVAVCGLLGTAYGLADSKAPPAWGMWALAAAAVAVGGLGIAAADGWKRPEPWVSAVGVLLIALGSGIGLARVELHNLLPNTGRAQTVLRLQPTYWLVSAGAMFACVWLGFAVRKGQRPADRGAAFAMTTGAYGISNENRPTSSLR